MTMVVTIIQDNSWQTRLYLRLPSALVHIGHYGMIIQNLFVPWHSNANFLRTFLSFLMFDIRVIRRITIKWPYPAGARSDQGPIYQFDGSGHGPDGPYGATPPFPHAILRSRSSCVTTDDWSTDSVFLINESCNHRVAEKHLYFDELRQFLIHVLKK
jgi:hypothetical protein